MAFLLCYRPHHSFINADVGNVHNIGADDYEYDDGLIDNSELKQKFTSRAIAKRKRKRQRNVGDSGFRIDNDEEDEEELDGDDEEDDDEDEVGDEEEGESGGDGMTRTQDGKTGSRPGGARPQGPKRRRRRQWLRDGEKDFKEVPQVKDAITDKLGIDGQKLADGRPALSNFPSASARHH